VEEPVADRRFVVSENIPVGGVWAYTRGQSIDADAVAANGWEDYVVSAGSKEAREIHAEITGRPAEDFDTKPAPSSSRTAAPTSTKEG
jgi:hypothetical protein